MRLCLEDFSGTLPAYAWKEDVYRGLYLPNYSLVHVEGRSRYFENKLRVDMDFITPVAKKKPGDVIRLIPQTICPLPWLLPTLQSVVNQISIAPLQRFVEEVLANDGISFAFVSAPASLNHHHNYPGGLLVHSLDCVSMVKKHREFEQESYELGIVAALFHDIGKVLTLTYQMERTSLGQSHDHDKLTLEVLAPYLKRLEAEWPQGARELRYLLTWKIKKPVPHYNMADLVTCCDRISSGLDLQKRA
jgi:3'-5' exoribonuclease